MRNAAHNLWKAGNVAVMSLTFHSADTNVTDMVRTAPGIYDTASHKHKLEFLYVNTGDDWTVTDVFVY